MDPVCWYLKIGYCKFGEYYKKQHKKEICSIQHCASNECHTRHPKVCKYFTFQQVWWEICLSAQNLLEPEWHPWTKQKNYHFIGLNQAPHKANWNTKKRVRKIQRYEKLKWDTFGEIASSSTGLKRHKTMNHKIVDKEHYQERAESLFCPPLPVVPYLNLQTSQELEISKIMNNSSDFNCYKCFIKIWNGLKTRSHKKKKMKMYHMSSVTMLPTPQSSSSTNSLQLVS